MSRRRCLLWALLVLFLPCFAHSQQSPFLPEDTYNKLVNEISGDIAYDNLRSLVMYHAPSGESQGFEDEAEWVMSRAKSYGLEDVHFVALPSWRSDPKVVDRNWTLKGGELWLIAPKTLKLGDVRETPTSVADNSPTADITADLVDVGEGTEESDYAGHDVAGKVVLAFGPPNKVKELACWARGALGIVSYYSTRTDPWTDHADQIAWTRVSAPKEGEKDPPPVFVISPRQGLALSREMSGRSATHIFSDSTSAGAPPTYRVHLKVEAEVTQPGRMGLVEAFIHGTTYHDQAIVLTAHMQEEKTSANDDRSGCANLLEIARALEAMIADGRLPRPQRDIRFWWTNEISAEYEYFSEHPEERTKILADINEDMVGARQSLGGRVQHISRTPYSRWSFVNDVVESIVTSLVQGNNAYLASWQNHNRAPYSRPVFSHLGTREPYNAEVVNYFDSTDHLVFNTGGLDIPGVTFTNWPDEYIHSTDDDLWQIDRTQLQRNALAVAASALYIANLDDAHVPTLLAVVSGQARERISHDLATGLALMAETAAKTAPGSASDAAQEGRSNDLHFAYHDALLLLDEAEKREVSGFETVRRFSPPHVQKLLESLEEDMKLTELNHQKRIEEWFLSLGGVAAHPQMEEREKLPATQIPKNIGTLGEYLRHREQIEGPSGLHGLMKFEALNYVDGKRSILDIYRAVRAESLSAGEWYYGTVKLEDIEDLFKAAEKEKAVEITTR